MLKNLFPHNEMVVFKVKSEIENFEKVLTKLSDSLEVSFDNQAIESQNSEIVKKILETKKMRNYLKAFNLISAVNALFVF